MFTLNDDMSIYVTRGDIVFFSVGATDEHGEIYKFKPDDVVRFKAFEKKACDKVVLQKDFVVTEETEEVSILLGEDDTKFGKVISKPRDYWYEVELNPFTNPQTIIGYDDDGPKVFRLYPEGKDIVDEIPEEELSMVDDELSPTSTRPIQNQAVTRAMTNFAEHVESNMKNVQDKVNETLQETEERMSDVEHRMTDVEIFTQTEAVSDHINSKVNPHGVTAEQVGARPNTWMPTASDVGALPIQTITCDYGNTDEEIIRGLSENWSKLPNGIGTIFFTNGADIWYGTYYKYTDTYGSILMQNASGVYTKKFIKSENKLIDLFDETGGTLTKDLLIKTASSTATSHFINYNDATYVRSSDGTQNNYADIVVSLSEAVRYTKNVNGSYNSYKIYGEHNITCGTTEPTSLATDCIYEMYE